MIMSAKASMITVTSRVSMITGPSCPSQVKNNAPAVGHLPIHVGHLNSFLELGDGNLTAKNRKVQMPGGGGMLLPGGLRVLRLQSDRYISQLETLRYPDVGVRVRVGRHVFLYIFGND